MFEPNQYRELCSELHVSEEKLEEVIQMTEQEKKRKFHRPMRLGLVAAAVAGNPAFAVSALEVERPGITYAVDTLRELREELPGVELVFIVGADAALTLPRWHESAELGRLAMFAAATRPGFELGEEALRVLRERRFDVRPFVVPGIDISSSELRQRVAEGRTIRYLVPEAVREIIEEEQLYRKEADHGRLA